jgi:hypothetical protein
MIKTSLFGIVVMMLGVTLFLGGCGKDNQESEQPPSSPGAAPSPAPEPTPPAESTPAPSGGSDQGTTPEPEKPADDMKKTPAN